MAKQEGQPARRSAVSPLSDRRGGPSTFTGTGYQVAFATFIGFQRLNEVRYNPTLIESLSCERRELVEDGQLGFDLGHFAASGRGLFEVKLGATADDVREFVDRAVVLHDEPRSGEVTYRMVAERPTSALEVLGQLIAHGNEAVDDAEFEALVTRSGKALEKDLFARLGTEPKKVVAIMQAPVVHSAQELEVLKDALARGMCQVGQFDALRSTVHAKFEAAHRDRALVDVRRLAGELLDSGQMATPHLVDTSAADTRLIGAVATLDECVAPLPVDVLATGLETTIDELLGDILSQHLAAGGVVLDDNDRLSISRPMEHRLPVVVDVAARTLRALTAEAATQGRIRPSVAQRAGPRSRLR